LRSLAHDRPLLQMVHGAVPAAWGEAASRKHARDWSPLPTGLSTRKLPGAAAVIGHLNHVNHTCYSAILAAGRAFNGVVRSPGCAAANAAPLEQAVLGRVAPQ